jgi:hypothetical protein
MWPAGFSFWYKKDSNAKKRKFLLHGTLKIVPSLQLKTRKQKKQNQSF